MGKENLHNAVRNEVAIITFYNYARIGESVLVADAKVQTFHFITDIEYGSVWSEDTTDNVLILIQGLRLVVIIIKQAVGLWKCPDRHR